MDPTADTTGPTDRDPDAPERHAGPAGHDGDPAADKAMLRTTVRAARAALDPQERRDQASGIDAALRGVVGAPSRARDVVMVFAGQGHEYDPLPMAPALVAAGWSLALPRVAGADLDVVAWGPDGTFATGPLGIREPTGPALADRLLRERLGVVVVPGVAFDRDGGRLGQGGGYYDRLLDRLERLGAEVRLVAPVFDVQLVDAVPREAHDRLVDVLVLPTGPVPARIARAGPPRDTASPPGETG